MKVDVQTKTGGIKSMSPQAARVMVAVGRATYLTRDMQALPMQPTEPLEILRTEDGDLVLNDMSAEALHAIAKKLGVKVHHAAGAEKVRAALIDSQTGDK